MPAASAFAPSTPRLSTPQQARRRQRVVRVALVSAVALGLLHYLSVQVQLRSCHRDAAAAPSAAAAAQQSVGLDGAQQPASSGGDWSAAGSAGRQQRIPRILHQSWKDANVPARFHKWQASWRELHPDWEFRLWTDEDNRRLLEEHYPWFLRTYDALPSPIMRADAIRPFYMHRHGGVYADLDVEALKPMGPLLQGRQPVLAYMSSTWWLRHNVPNAFMASPPGHPFWQFCWAHTMLEFRPGEVDYSSNEGATSVELVTGPRALLGSLEAYNAATGRNVTVLPPGQVFAYDWHKIVWCKTPECVERSHICSANDPAFNPAACKAHYPDAYAITYWAHTWGPNSTETQAAAAKAAAAAAGAGAEAAVTAA